jgi:hypothetical protein
LNRGASLIPVEKICKFWISKDGFCRARREKTECFGNLWYCDFPTDKNLLKAAEEEDGGK